MCHKPEFETYDLRCRYGGVEGPSSHLGDSLLQTVEGVDYRHVPSLALCQWSDHLTGIALSAELEKATGGGTSFEWFVLLLVLMITDLPTYQLLRLDAEKLHSFGGVLSHGHREVWVD